jgi:penicillin-binding protein 2
VSNLANNGVVMKPHLVKSIEDPSSKVRKLTVPKESYRIPLRQENIDFVKSAMIGVTKEGTSARSFANAPYTSGGKTGTAQAAAMSKTVKYDASKIAERLRDHSLYVAFAPADKPKIALAVIVENAGFGAAAAAPIARLAIDYYLTGKRPDEPVAKVEGGTDAQSRSEASKPENKKPEINKPESGKVDSQKVDPNRAEAQPTKSELKKSEASNPDAAKAEAVKPGIGNTGKPDTGKPDLKKNEPAPAAVPKNALTTVGGSATASKPTNAPAAANVTGAAKGNEQRSAP